MVFKTLSTLYCGILVVFTIRFEEEKIRKEEAFGEEKLWKVCSLQFECVSQNGGRKLNGPIILKPILWLTYQ